MVFKHGKPFMPLGTPGGDVQCQAMLQVFLNIAVFGMLPQAAIEAPRFATYSYPGSFEPHAYQPDELRIERRLAEEVGDTLGRERPQNRDGRIGPGKPVGSAPSRLTIPVVLAAGADPRRTSYAIGW